MDQRKLLLILGAGIIALGTGLAAKSMLTGAAAPAVQAVVAPQPTGPKVLVAQRSLPVGTIITADAVNFQQWPKDMVQDAYFVDGKGIDMNKLIGTVVRYPITAGQPLTQGALVAPGDRGFLAAALGPGMRAITIPVSDKSAVAGFVFPGDHVDLILTQAIKVTSTGPNPGTRIIDDRDLHASETIIKNLRVLATDQSPVSDTGADGKTVVKSFKMVTVEVTPRLAEKIEVAQSLGSIDMTLRSIADNQSELDKAIATGAIKVPAGTGKADEAALMHEAINKPVDGATTFATGGDVSRFQRRTLPAQESTASMVKGVKSMLDATLGHAGTGMGVKVVRGNAESEPVTGGTGLMGAVGNLMNSVSNGAGRAGTTLGGGGSAGPGGQ